VKIQRNLLLFISLLLITGLFWQVNPAQGQPLIQIASVQVGLFPEYDRPNMLVVLHIELVEDPGGKQMLALQVPTDADSLSIFKRTENEDPTPLDVEVFDIGKWKDIRFATDGRNIQVEYYDPNLVLESAQRAYEYQWLSIYSVDSFSLTVRQPFGAGSVHSEPPLNTRVSGPDNATYFTGKMGSIPAGELFSLSLEYTKDPTNPAYPALAVEPAKSVNDATPGRTPSPLSVIMWLLTVALAVLVLVSLYYWWFKSNVMEKRDRMVQGVGIMNPEKQVVFCHECGMRSRPADSYCSNCGTELRRPTGQSSGH